MSHSIIATLDRGGYLRWEARCNEPEGARCRLDCGEGCESWRIERDDQGHFHTVETFDGQPTIRHDMIDSGQCAICDWLNADQSLIPELYDGREDMVLANLEIVPTWEGPEEGFTWESKAQSRKPWTGDTTGPDAWMGEPR